MINLGDMLLANDKPEQALEAFRESVDCAKSNNSKQQRTESLFHTALVCDEYAPLYLTTIYLIHVHVF